METLDDLSGHDDFEAALDYVEQQLELPVEVRTIPVDAILIFVLVSGEEQIHAGPFHTRGCA